MSDLAAYHAWNIALARFGASPEELKAEQARRLADEVARAQALEARILETREAMAVTLPYDRIADAVTGWREENPRCAISDAVLFEALHRELRVQAVLDAVAARASAVSAREVRDYYDANLDSFVRPERRRIRHILVTVNPDFAENVESRARARIDGIAGALRGGADFAELAQRHSECPTAMRGGEVGVVADDALYPELAALAFALPTGEWGGPVRTELGWHLVACEAIVPAEIVPYADAAEQVRAHLAKLRRRTEQTAWLKALVMRPMLVGDDPAAA
ncbi:Nitrogen fixation protein NifM [uncultured Alphaproteobacteria bacterium]|uniref:Parvulin-like PPIase n=1 Tax=uncultured Alphaproteobacteria bacterium TaxID=91750 RepID=A0A212K4Q6_9PROT|nr:Nitrogen fixation protein NifM [uncultured Alphaproteobacteria bacterium]